MFFACSIFLIILSFFAPSATVEQIPPKQAACSQLGPYPFGHVTQLCLLYEHVTPVLQIYCEHGLISIHFPFSHLADVQSGTVSLGQVIVQILGLRHWLSWVQVLIKGTK